MPQPVAWSVPRMLRVFLLTLTGIDFQTAARQRVAGGTTDMRPFAVALSFGYQAQQWTFKATVWRFGR